ncbi:DUF1553 domain-containing protein [bacterium]|nr:DUF1553 domain-containing protein [bacterium]
MRCALSIFTVFFGLAGLVRAADPVSSEGLKFYETEVLPILQQHCYKCHGEGKNKGGLSLAGRKLLLTGGDSGPAINPEKPAESVLLDAINFRSFEMPPAGKLPPEQIAILTKWVELGASMPEGTTAPATPHHGVPQVNEETKNHWSFRRIVRPEVPTVDRTDWVRNPIDAFILAKFEAAGLSPNPPALPQPLIRRLHYDLLGLPPSLELVQRFEADDSDATYQAIIRELLDSPHHGEHYARYWLDVVRYAESNSYERDNPKPFVWRYRDYVIDFFNSDRGYDEFIKEQLAGDEFAERSSRALIATGYYRLGLWDDEPVDAELAFYDGLDDLVGTTSQAFLGLTMNCARCHDHKLDPLPQKDYYSFAAFFRNTRHYGQRSDDSVYAASIRSIATPEEEAMFAVEKQQWDERVGTLRKQLDEIEARVRPMLQGGEKDDFENDSQRLRVIRKHAGEWLPREEVETYAQIRKTWNDLRNHPPRSGAQALCITEHGPQAPATHVLIRGSHKAPGDVVEPAFPVVLSPPSPHIQPPANGQSTGRRTALAEWIASPQNPLTARVMVNRIWQWHFGRGLVTSPNDFGLKGEAPSHPELLDWLAAEFMEHGWSLRHLHHLILTSNTYRISSAPNDEALAKDPQNHLFWRFDMRRLRAEELRDSILAENDSLNLETMYGPSIYPTIEKEVLAGQSQPGRNWEQSSPDDKRRRSIYIHIKRSLTVPLLANFDVAEADVTCPVRFATTQPTQALTMLNSAFLLEEAQRLADVVQQDAGDDRASQVTEALRRVLQREPTSEEIQRGLIMFDRLVNLHQLTRPVALKYFCLMALNLNEFVYLD